MTETTQDPGLTVRAEVKRDRTRRRVVTVSLLVMLLAAAVYLFVVFSPLADAAGGCGGG